MHRIRSRIVPARRLRGLRWLSLVAVATLAADACARNPVTGERELVLISESQEIELGRQAYEEALQSIGVVEDDALQAYVQRIGEELARESERPQLPWTFRVVEDPTPNAFALPGGFIAVTRGLMGLMDSEAELATVLGHEIGHVTARHSVQQISRQQLGQIGLGVGMILFPSIQPLGDVLGGGLGLLFLKYGRDAERQADELGFKYALRENYDVREMPDVFRTLQRVGETEGRSPLPSWLSTHPYPAERIEAAEERLADPDIQAQLRTTQLARAEYLGRIDGLVYGENPRNGFFEGGVFYHPDLRFRLTFPEGWPTQNLPRTVAAASPEQDAVAQLELAQATSSSAAARQFFGQEGIQGGDVRRETISGLPAVVGYFQAQTQQGAVTGIASFIEHGGRVYRILGYGASNRFGQYDRTFQRVIGSFAPVTDPRILGVQPRRIDIVRIERSMTLAEFNRTHPSVVPIEDLELINQVAGADARLAAGTRVKRVVRGTAQ